MTKDDKKNDIFGEKMTKNKASIALSSPGIGQHRRLGGLGRLPAGRFSLPLL